MQIILDYSIVIAKLYVHQMKFRFHECEIWKMNQNSLHFKGVAVNVRINFEIGDKNKEMIKRAKFFVKK